MQNFIVFVYLLRIGFDGVYIISLLCWVYFCFVLDGLVLWILNILVY